MQKHEERKDKHGARDALLVAGGLYLFSLLMGNRTPVLASGDAYSRAVLASRPDFYYRHLENAGVVAHDSSGNGNHGAYTGVVTLNQAGFINYDPASRSILLAGAGYVSVPQVVAGPALGNNWTYECSVSLAAYPAGSARLFSTNFGGNADIGLAIGIDATGHVFVGTEGVGVDLTGATALAIGTDYYINVTQAIIAGSLTTSIYVNNVLDARSASAGYATYVNHWCIGVLDFNGTLAGFLDAHCSEEAFYKNGLSDADRATHYATWLAP